MEVRALQGNFVVYIFISKNSVSVRRIVFLRHDMLHTHMSISGAKRTPIHVSVRRTEMIILLCHDMLQMITYMYMYPVINVHQWSKENSNTSTLSTPSYMYIGKTHSHNSLFKSSSEHNIKDIVLKCYIQLSCRFKMNLFLSYQSPNVFWQTAQATHLTLCWYIYKFCIYNYTCIFPVISSLFKYWYWFSLKFENLHRNTRNVQTTVNWIHVYI